ncbi:MAG: hypothetical protein IPN77_23080 [Sandaracinaceae bacterium]|nr:hypothetical protein [Sandaracinaceae bacterium]
MDARGRDAARGGHRGVEGPTASALRVVGLAEAIDGDAHGADAGVLRGAHHLVVETEAPRGDAHHHAVRNEGARDHQPVGPQVGLAADERDLAHLRIGQLLHHVEGLLGAQLAAARGASAAPAVPAAEVARERELPHRIDRVRRGEVVVPEVARGARRAAAQKSSP